MNDTHVEIKLPSGLSPSTLDTYRQCPQKWAFEKLEKRPTTGNIKAEMGTFGHAVLEELMKLPSQQRTRAEAKSIANRRWANIQKEHPELFGYVNVGEIDGKEATPKAIATYVNKGIDGAFSLLPPKKIEVYTTELWIEGHVGTVPMRGYIDLVVYDGPRLKVLDWKTGKAPWSHEDVTKKLTQVSVYCALLAGQGHDVSGGELLYVTPRKRFSVDWNAYAEAAVVQEAEEVWAAIRKDFERGVFEPTPNFLCYNEDPSKVWCDHKPYCPAWM